MKLHEAIKKERERQKISKYRMAKDLETSASYYARLEKGETNPSQDRIEAIAKLLNVKITIHSNGKATIHPDTITLKGNRK